MASLTSECRRDNKESTGGNEVHVPPQYTWSCRNCGRPLDGAVAAAAAANLPSARRYRRSQKEKWRSRLRKEREPLKKALRRVVNAPARVFVPPWKRDVKGRTPRKNSIRHRRFQQTSRTNNRASACFLNDSRYSLERKSASLREKGSKRLRKTNKQPRTTQE